MAEGMLAVFGVADPCQHPPGRRLLSGVDDVFARAVAAGATVLTEVTNHRPGAYMSLFKDPHGNTWELFQEERGTSRTCSYPGPNRQSSIAR